MVTGDDLSVATQLVSYWYVQMYFFFQQLFTIKKKMTTTKWNMYVHADSNPVSRAFDQNIPNGQPLPPPSLQSFKVIVTADTKVMTEKFVKELLPMQVKR